MAELLRETVVQAQGKKTHSAELVWLERLSDHLLTEGLFCFRQIPDIEQLLKALQDALRAQAGFSATSVGNNPAFLMHRNISAIAFSACSRAENCADFSDIEMVAGDHAWSAPLSDRDGTCPLTRFRLMNFNDGYSVLLYRSVHRREDGDICRKLVEQWSNRYVGAATANADSLFGGALECVTKKQWLMSSAKARGALGRVISQPLDQDCGAENNADDFVKKVKQKYCTKKYAKSGLKLDQSKLLWIKLRQLFEKEAPYLNVDFDLRALAERMNVKQQILSQVISTNAGMHFYELIDGYRVAVARALLSDSVNAERKLLDIALSSGYSCQSTFFSHFKRATGMTPDAYRRLRMNQPKTLTLCSDR